MALDKDSMLSAEYQTLRTEILQRISTRYTVINFALLLFAAALGFQRAFLVLLYPVIACFLLGKYVSNEHSKDEIKCYINTYIEKPLIDKPNGYEGWQHFKDGIKQDSFVHVWGRGLFVITSVITLVVAFGIETPTSSNIVLDIQYIVAFASILVSVGLIFSGDRPKLSSNPVEQAAIQPQSSQPPDV